MTKFVVDSCVVVKWFVSEDNSDNALRLFNDNFELIIPDFLALEVANVLWQKCRRGEIQYEQARDCLSGLAEKIDRVESGFSLVGEAFTFANRFSHPTYDCLYLALANELNATLVTSDRKLYAVAPKAGVRALLLGDTFDAHLIRIDLEYGLSAIVPQCAELIRLARQVRETMRGPSESTDTAIEKFRFRENSPAYSRLHQFINTLSPAGKVALMTACEAGAAAAFDIARSYYRNVERVHRPDITNLEQYIILHLLHDLEVGEPRLQSFLAEAPRTQG